MVKNKTFLPITLDPVLVQFGPGLILKVGTKLNILELGQKTKNLELQQSFCNENCYNTVV